MTSNFHRCYFIPLLVICTAWLHGCDDTEQPITDPVTPVCGDSVCEFGEDFYACNEDCPAPQHIIDRGLLDGKLTHFPDNLLTVDDPSTDTGIRVEYNGAFEALEDNTLYATYRAFQQVQGMDGFGTTAGGFISLPSRPNPDSFTSGPASADPGTSVIMGYNHEGATTIIPVETEVFLEDPGVVVRPMYPLPEGAKGFIALTTQATERFGTPYRMDIDLYDTLHANAPSDYQRVSDSMNTVADQLISTGYINNTEDLAFLTTFTVQDPISKAMRIKEYIQQQEPEIKSITDCTTSTNWTHCEVSFTSYRYMDEQLRIADDTDGTPVGTYTVKAAVFLPNSPGEYGPAPYPTVFFGHGLTGNRADGDQIADFFAPEGVATVVIDAPVHGDHPTATESGGPFAIITTLFGLHLEGDAWIDSRVLRDGWRQSNYDKLAFMEILQHGLDADDDGTDDIDPERIFYFGASMGAIQGLEFIALTTDTIGNLMAVGGARITDIVRTGDMFSSLIELLFTGSTKKEVGQFYVLLQTVVDGGDPASFAHYVFHERLYGDSPKPLAVQMSVPDAVVANPSNAYYIRSLGVPLIGRVAYPISLVPEVSSPLENNHPSGVTAGALQTDWIWKESEGKFVRAEHSTGPASEEAILYWQTFVESLLDGQARLIDPYPEFGRERPPLETPKKFSRSIPEEFSIKELKRPFASPGQ